MKRLSENESWITNSGSWVILVIATFLGIVSTESLVDWKEALRYDWLTAARLVFALGLAIGVVYHDSRRGMGDPINRIRKRVRLPQRVVGMYSAGCAVVIIPLSAWKLVSLIAQGVVK